MLIRGALFGALSFFALTGMALAQAVPQVTSVDPPTLYANLGSIVDLTFNGTNLTLPAETGYTFTNDVKLLARRNGQSFADASKDIKDWTSGRLDIEFDSTKFNLQTPGTLDFIVAVKGVRSAIISIPIMPYPNVPPTITSIGPNAFNENLPLQHQYMFRIYAKNTPDDTKVSVNGEQLTFFADADFTGGAIDVYVPEDLRSRPGQYAVVISSRSGDSNAVMLQIRDPRFAATSSAIAVKTKLPFATAKNPIVPIATTLATVGAIPNAAVTPKAVLPAKIAAINPFVGLTPVPAVAPKSGTALANAALKTPASLMSATPVAMLATPPPIKLGSAIKARYQGVAAILLPSLRSALEPIIANEVAAMRGGLIDPGTIAIGSIKTIRPNATPLQLQVLEAYVLVSALDTASDTSQVTQQQLQELQSNRQKAFETVSNFAKKTSDVQDTIVQNLK